MPFSLKRLRKRSKMPSIETFFIFIFLAMVALDIRSFATRPWASKRHFWLCIITFWIAVITYDLNKDRVLVGRKTALLRQKRQGSGEATQDEAWVKIPKDFDSTRQL